MNFLLRTVATIQTEDGPARFGNHMYHFARYTAGVLLSREAFVEMQLPVSIDDPAHPHLGTGLTLASSTEPCAYLASLATAATGTQPLLLMTNLNKPVSVGTK